MELPAERRERADDWSDSQPRALSDGGTPRAAETDRPPASGPRFQVHEEGPMKGDVLLAGFSEYGLAGLTAVDYLVDQLELTRRGHVTTPDLPTITPFTEGTPRHPIGIFGHEDHSITVLVGELQVPPGAARSFSSSLLEWTASAGISEVAVLSGVPMAHTESDHRTYYVATEDYQEARLEDTELPPMANGFTDGVKASLLSQGIDSSLRVCVYTTPAHPQTPDVPAALRMLETVDDVYDIGLDTGPLEDFAADVERYYTELAEHIERSRDERIPDDRMYM